MPVADRPQSLEKAVLRDDVAALALDRLDHDRGDLVGRRELVEQDLIEPAQVLHPAERGMEDARQEWTEPGVVLRLGRGERDGSVRPAMERPEECDDVRSARRPAGQLYRGLDDLRPAVAKVGPRPAAGDRRDLGEAPAQLRIDRQVEVRRREVDELGGLLLDRRDDLGMAVAGRVDRDAGREVEEEVAVDVLDRQALAADRHDRVRARQAR